MVEYASTCSFIQPVPVSVRGAVLSAIPPGLSLGSQTFGGSLGVERSTGTKSSGQTLTANSGRRVLIVDDDSLSRELLCDCLEPLGLDISQARDGVEALREIEAELPSLMLVDIQMPRMNGFELLRYVRSNPATASIPVLAVSAFAMAGDAERALARGFDHYITKPVALGELRKLVRRLLPKDADPD